MGIPAIMSDLALILILASIATFVFKWLKQPVILGYIVAGFLASSSFDLMPSVSDVADVELWAKIGVIFLLFALGLEFSFKKLANVGRSALIAAMVIIPGMILLGLLVGMLLGWTPMNSFMLGCMICMSSTTIILKALDDLDLRNHRFTGLVFGVLIFEDLIAILMMVLMSTAAVGREFEGTDFILAILKLAFFLVIWLVCGIFFLPTVLKKCRSMLSDETLLIVSVGLCFGMVFFASSVGFSAEFGAFVMGSILAETIEAERINKVVSPLKDLFGSIFFISVGMMIDPEVLATYWQQILIISATIIIGQICLGTSGVLISGGSLRSAIQSGFSLTQVGEFAFIVALLGTQLGLCSSFLYPVIVAVSVVTIFITPFMMRSAIPVYEYVDKKLPEKWRIVLERTNLAGSTKQSHNVWKDLLMQLLEIVCIYGVICGAIVAIFVTYLFPAVSGMESALVWEILLSFVAIMLIAPFARAIMAKKNRSKEYKYLLRSNKRNWAPLMILTFSRYALAVAFIAVVLFSAFPQLHHAILIVIAALISFYVLHSRPLKYYSIKIERRFFHNLNIREMEHQKRMDEAEAFKRKGLSKRLSAYDLHLADYLVDPNADVCGKTLIELGLRNVYGVHVVSIIRGDARINIPGGKEMILPFDRILVLGTDEQLPRLSSLFAKPADIVDAVKCEVGLEQIEIEEGSELQGKSILECGIRDKAKCLVVGIEKKGVAMMNPNIQTQFEVGDIVWIVGERDKIRQLAKTTSFSIVGAK